ncbi:MAG TPA: HDOD domain-containing protein [Vicinamibacterales bacterium]|jgi:EAL and modified HD-GYP domain-containing signal transduction protein
MGANLTAATDVFVARQPIFDERQRVYAYELLFRSGPENYFATGFDSEIPTSRVISNGMSVGLGTLTDQKPAFVNFTHSALVDDFAFALSPRDVVIEILESVAADEAALAACRRLKVAGYRIALDDYVEEPERMAFVEFADFIKVDVLQTPADSRGSLARKYRTERCHVLAEKVETRAALNEAAALGFQYFQGYFFARPVVMASKAIPGFRLNYLRLLQELNQAEIDLSRLEDVIKQEASITFRLLRRVNSAAYGFRVETSSIRHALVLLGEREIKTCATVWAMAEMARDQPFELVIVSTLRARLCEMLAAPAGLAAQGSDLFLVGMFSLLDVILEQPMDKIVSMLPLSPEIKQALLGQQNPLRAVLDCVTAYERGRWDEACALASTAGFSEGALPSSYLEAIDWTRNVFEWPS